jgi:hypothetical protein
MLVHANNSPGRQKGLVLLGIVIFFVLAVIAYFLSGMSVVEIRQYQVERTAKSLQQAKQALIAYAVTYGDIDGDADLLPDFPGAYGFLPCPDYNAGLAEGLEDNGNCGVSGLPKLGYFPWKTLDLPVLKDAGGACLLYAVTGEYKNDENLPSTKTQMLNEDTNGMFQIIDDTGAVVRGVNPEDRVVAVILAPGKALPGQDRDFTLGSFCGDDYANFNAYLEDGGGADNSDVTTVLGTLDQFIHATAASTDDANPNPHNDLFVTITRDEIWSAIVSRTDFVQKMTDLTEALAMCLSDYAAANTLDRLPWPVTTVMADYRDTANYNDNASSAPGYAGRFPFTIDDSNAAIPGANISSALFSEAGCNAVNVTSGATVDLQTIGAEYRVLWENWKDHFFYVVSRDYAPDNVAAACGTCITVGPGPGIGAQRAAAVIFANTRQGGQVRDEPIGGDADTKFNVNNYMDNGNGANFPDIAGNGNYLTSATNDIMYCLTTASPPTVVPC